MSHWGRLDFTCPACRTVAGGWLLQRKAWDEDMQCIIINLRDKSNYPDINDMEREDNGSDEPAPLLLL